MSEAKGMVKNMKLTTILFDLDGTLLPMDNDVFTKGYFKLLVAKLAPYGYEAEKLVDAIWKGTAAMVKNNGTKSNSEAFWQKFSEIYGKQALADKPIFDEFYEKEFQEARKLCGVNPKASETVRQLKERGLRTALATNPIFPAAATKSRIQWAGLSPSDFEFYTTYENTGWCKPNPDYYKNILQKLGACPEEVLMVGNDVTEDMIAETIGMRVFLLTDCLINKECKDINLYPHGSFEQLLKFVNLS